MSRIWKSKSVDQRNFSRPIAQDGGAGVQCKHILLASEIVFGALGLIVEVASVLDGDLIPFLGLVGAVALVDNLPSDTHCAGGSDRCC